MGLSLLIYRIPSLIPRFNMGRKTVLFGFWLLGYILGFLAWGLRGPVVNLVSTLGVNQEVATALLAGVLGGFLMMFSVLIWSAIG